MGVPLKDRLIFSHAFEALFFRALKGRLTDRMRERVRAEAGVDLSKPFVPAYSHGTWEKCLVIVAHELFPTATVESALEEVGVILTRGYFETLVGAAVAGLVKVLGPARALARMDRSLKSGNNYSEVKATQLGPKSFEFWANETGVAQYHLLGVLRQGAVTAGAKNARLTIVKRDEESITLRVEWE